MTSALESLPPLRFWDESVRVPGMFENFRRSADRHVNAVACFDRMARHRHWELAQRQDFDPGKESVVSIFQPKSGGTFLHNRMLRLGYCDFAWCFPHRLCLSQCFAGNDALELFMAGGCAYHTHARPDPNILAALDRAGVQKVWVHLRNPAESAISSYYHYLGEGQGEGELGEQRKQLVRNDAARMGLVPGMDVSTFAVENIAWYIEWVACWFRYVAEHPGLVVLSYYHELTDPKAMFARVFSELGVDVQGEINAAPMGDDRYRAKRSGLWGSDVSPEVRRFLEKRVASDLERYPQFPDLRV